MSYLTEAFKALDALNEDTFSVSDDGIKKLAEFEDNDDLVDEITVYDADAEDTEDIEDSYVGKVIVDCNVCHSKIYKDKSDVVIDEETQNANINEECPYCYSTDGFKVIGEVAPMSTETEEKVEVEDKLKESLNEAQESIPSPWNTYLEISDYTPDAESGEYQIGDTIEGNTILAYLDPKEKYEEIIDTFMFLFRSPEGKNFVGTTLKGRVYPYTIEDFPQLKKVDEEPKKPKHQITKDEAERLISIAAEYLSNHKDKLDEDSFFSSSIGIYAGARGGAHVRAAYDLHINIYPLAREYAVSDTINKLLEVRVSKNFRERTVYVDTESKLIKTIDNWLDSIPPVEDDLEESLNEAVDLLTKENTIASVLSKHMDELSKYTDANSMRNAIIDILDKSEIADKDSVKKLKRVLFSKKSTGALLSTIATYMTGEKVAKVGRRDVRRKAVNENIGTDIDEYQQWVDYDMKRYGKISDQTNKEIKEAGLQVVKDKYGDYQVIAGKYDESLKEDLDRDLSIISDIIDNYKDITGYDIVDIFEKDSDEPVFNQEIVDKTSDKIKEYVLNKYNIDITKDSDILYELDNRLLDIKPKLINESVKDVTITTDDSKTTMTSDDKGKVTLTTEPVEQHKDDEVIEPLTDETEAEIEANDGEEDIDIEDFDEESFDELGEGYFKNVYENVNSFKTFNITTKDNKVIVEGVITFDNNVKKNTSFLFESANKTKNGKYRFIGENLNVTKGNKAFSLIGNVANKKFLSESMNYNYRTKNDIGKFIRCCGTIKRG